jgi:type IV secretory pathway VirB2 component (pilin)
VSWQWPRKLKQGLGSACCVEVSPGGNNSGENSPKVIDLRRNAQRRYPKMTPLWSKTLRFRKILRQLAAAALGLLLAAPAFAQGASPWENAVGVLQQAFTSTIARGLSLVAIVVSGLTFAFGEGGSKRVLAGVLFGVGMAIAAVNFMAWLFP